MYFENIIDQIAQLMIVYYSEYRIRKNRPLHEHNDIDMNGLLEYINTSMMGLYNQICPNNKRIIAIDTLLWPDEKMYWFDLSTINIHPDIIHDIIFRMKEYVHNRGFIFNNDDVITIICEHKPCEYVTKFQIKHGTIIGIIDLYTK